ncbi:MAG: bifunctional ADP-dependent NAD(P)H-hydrate dehydratase/NAD(P)H-hydrate epimerase [Sulfobacillus thermosulfidooxidans]|nr:MAG: bifunctional ADP-dependent NAD(P)H-hydrate dehydratase/NAD(P)H-hydrate epimerase [Sulfobacillus thermosulfidooxidans]
MKGFMLLPWWCWRRGRTMRHNQIWSVEEARHYDRRTQDFGVGFLSLMEVAGAKAAARWGTQLPKGRGLVLAGPGHNGGDALVVARYLARDHDTDVCFPLAEPQFAGAKGLKQAAIAYGARVVAVDDVIPSVAHYAWVVDGIFGTGFHGNLDPTVAQIFEAISAAGTAMYVLDILSGVDADSGAYQGPPLAIASTVTFGGAKWGHFGYPGALYTGPLTIADIGLEWPTNGDGWISPKWAYDHRPVLAVGAHKYQRGRVAVVGGSVAMTGAPVMAGMAALRAGAGLVQLIVPHKARRRMAVPEPLMVWPSTGRGLLTTQDLEQLMRADVIIFGPGMGRETGVLALEQVVGLGKPLIVDADGLYWLAKRPDLRLPARSLLTPHSGEMGMLLGISAAVVDHNRVSAFHQAYRRYQTTLVLKGLYTLTGDAQILVNTANTPVLATAGSGDVLSGIVAGILASAPQMSSAQAAALATYVHGWSGIHAARHHGRSVVATDLIECLGQAWHSVETEEEPPQLPQWI